ncbi:endopeptidase La [Candidatus Poribacteria bacterium]|nr:endopeptidase La [Candidatus Poribacteria bacterium]
MEDGQLDIPEVLGVLPLRNVVVYPHMVAPLTVARTSSVRLIQDAKKNDSLIALVAQKKPEVENPKPKDLFTIGTVGKIVRQLQFPNNVYQIWVHGISRIQVEEFVDSEAPYMVARSSVLMEETEQDTELEALERTVIDILGKIASLSEDVPEDLTMMAKGMGPSATADMVSMYMNISLDQKQRLLEITDVKERLSTLRALLSRELSVLELSKKIQTEASEEMSKAQREFYLRKKMGAIKKELGEDDEASELDDLKEQIEKAGMPEEAKKQAERELNRLTKMHPSSAEYTVSRTYLGWLLDVPWSKHTEDMLDISKAKKILDEDHYDLEKVKDRILEYLAVRKLKADMKGSILCFVGPPGVGKTSLGKSIARAMGRKFVRMSLGGVRDEAEIRGHRRTYIGSLPGRIIQGLKKAESNNPVFMLDEVDKLGRDFRGDPSSALLEVLDPEQNHSFADHYLEVPFDLSRVMFITTANVLDTIPPALLDRMEVLRLPGYTEVEKLEIAKRYLLPKQLEGHGITKKQLTISDGAIRNIIRNYTREAGVRNLEREIGTVCRKAAKGIAQEETEKCKVTVKNLHEYLGPEKFYSETAERADEPGVGVGLAWTPTGGDIIFIEAARMKHTGRKNESLTLTGQLGDVMRESAQAALSYVRSRADILGIEPDFFDKYDVHLHVPAGATPKDGPSAGITMATVLASLATKTPIKEKLAMTGEITLRGRILPIGGVKEKVLAASRAGINEIILPMKNKKDLQEIPEEIRDKVEIHLVDNMDEVLCIAFPTVFTPEGLCERRENSQFTPTQTPYKPGVGQEAL